MGEGAVRPCDRCSRSVFDLERFNRILESYPDYVDMDKVLFFMGRTLSRMESYARAEIYLGQLLRDHPESEYVKPARKLLAAAPTVPEPDGGSTD